MSEIFISYASSDREFARQLSEALESAGWSVWWDREIPVGESFDQVIEEKLNAARCVVVLWSKQSVVSRWVKAESAAAADRERLVPALIEEVPIPLEFRRIQTATLVDWHGDTANPEFQRLVEAVRNMVAQPEPVSLGRPQPHSAGRSASRKPFSPRLLGASAVALLIILALVLARNPQGRRQEIKPQLSKVPAQSVQPPPAANLASPDSTSQPPRAYPAPKPSEPSGVVAINIGDQIGDGVPAPGAGVIETPYTEDLYSFTAVAGQRVYFRVLESSQGMGQIGWRLLDANGMEVFTSCLGCSEPGVQTLSKGGDYTLTVGGKTNPSTGTYRLRLYDVPAADRFPIKIGDEVKDNLPGPGAGVIESPGAEDIYTFSATPRQNVYFRVLESSQGMGLLGWRLLDANGMEVFTSCLGCSEPGVQTLSKGGEYMLIVGSRTSPATGHYAFKTSSR
jgi:hypothetical protein